MDAELSEQIAALQTMLEVAKRHQEQSPEFLREALPPIMNVLTQIYQSLYQWYREAGSPGGETPEQFNEWLASMV